MHNNPTENGCIRQIWVLTQSLEGKGAHHWSQPSGLLCMMEPQGKLSQGFVEGVECSSPHSTFWEVMQWRPIALPLNLLNDACELIGHSYIFMFKSNSATLSHITFIIGQFFNMYSGMVMFFLRYIYLQLFSHNLYVICMFIKKIIFGLERWLSSWEHRCFCKALGFSFPNGCLQASVTPGAGEPTPSLAYTDPGHASGT